MKQKKLDDVLEATDSFTDKILGFLYWGIDMVFSYTDKTPPRFLYHSDESYLTRYPDQDLD